MIISNYQIIYTNGITQFKNLILHSDYLKIVRPMQDKIFELEGKKKLKEASYLKKELFTLVGESFFTTESPLGKAIDTEEIIVSPWMDSSYNFKVKIVKQ